MSLNDFLSSHSLVLKDRDNWRITKPIIGEIHGLPSTYGVLKATNGMLCFIELSEGRLFEGHLLHFIPRDMRESVEVAKLLIVKSLTTKPTKFELAITDLLKS